MGYDIVTHNFVSKIKDLYDKSLNSDNSAFEEMVKELASLALFGTGVDIILQRDINTFVTLQRFYVKWIVLSNYSFVETQKISYGRYQRC